MGLLNGWTPKQIKKVISTQFKGRAFVPSKYSFQSGAEGSCLYLTSDGKKCGVGLFIPDGHPAQKSREGVVWTLEDFPDLSSMMPLAEKALFEIQYLHDKDEEFRFADLNTQKKMLYRAIIRLSRGQDL